MNYQRLLKGSFVNIMRLCLCLLVLFISTAVWGGNVHTVVKKKAEYSNVEDNLVIKKNNGKREYTILPETKIKLWTENGKMKGRYKRIENGQVVISVEGEEKKVSIRSIHKIKIRKSAIQEGVGGFFAVVGGGAIAFGGISLVAGIVAVLDDNLGALILIAVPFLALGGAGLYFLGKALRGRKFNFKKKWHIERPSISKNNEP